MSRPGTLVRMGLKGPRTSAGASGLRSKVSRWLGPPLAQKRMTEKSLLSECRCSAASRPDRVGSTPLTRAPRLRPPIFSQLRRSSGPRQGGVAVVIGECPPSPVGYHRAIISATPEGRHFLFPGDDGRFRESGGRPHRRGPRGPSLVPAPALGTTRLGRPGASLP